MIICQKHWDALRNALNERGLGALVSENGEQVIDKTVREYTEGRTLDTYDPLMAAFWAISANGMDFIHDMGGDLRVLMVDLPDRPFDRCTICYLNWMLEQHTATCTRTECKPGKSYEWMIDRAADDQVTTWKSLSAN